MALYYSLVFGLLVVEMAFFAILSLPFPRKIRRTVLATTSAPFRNLQFQIGIKFVIGFVLILFIDASNRVYSVTQELHGKPSYGGQESMINNRAEVQSRRFYAQRNMYLTGFTLFLTLILNRTYSLVAELVVTKDKLDQLQASDDTTDSPSTPDVEELKKKLAAKDEELEKLQEQAKGLSGDYESVSTGAQSKKEI